ncbi:Uncharacterised protein [Mycobacteroides abscessus subsp. massiliense]|nr:Uncharacterised protein [Mycobacteroides abscessus subsp. massiliense]
MSHVIGVVAVGVVLAGVAATRFLAVECAHHGHLGELEQEAELDGLKQVAVVALALVVHRDSAVPLLECVDVVERLLEGVFGTEHRGIVVHRLLQFGTDVGHPLVAVLGQHVRHPFGDHRRRVLRQIDEVVGLGVLGRGDARPATEHVDVQQRVGAQPVGAVHRHAGAFAGCVQAGNHVVVVA